MQQGEVVGGGRLAEMERERRGRLSLCFAVIEHLRSSNSDCQTKRDLQFWSRGQNAKAGLEGLESERKTEWKVCFHNIISVTEHPSNGSSNGDGMLNQLCRSICPPFSERRLELGS